VCWIADHWDDVMSDWSAIHRTSEAEVEHMTAREFWPRAVRLIHYPGTVREVALHEYRKAQPDQEQPAPPTATEPAEVVDPTPAQIRALRDAARRKRYPADKFGEVKYVTDNDIVREAGRGA